jgi:hypothetical protein
MVENPGKSAHMEVAPRTPPPAAQLPWQLPVHAAASAQASAPLTIQAVAGMPSMEIATVSGEGHWVKNLGYYLNTSLYWTRQWQHIQAKLGAAALIMCQAATGRPCHLAITALLTQHDVSSCLPYSLMAAGTKRGDLEGALSALIEPVRQRAGLPKTATAHAMLCGDLSDKGTGITDPLALNVGVKCSALLDMLNGSHDHATRALLHTYNSISPKDGLQPGVGQERCRGTPALQSRKGWAPLPSRQGQALAQYGSWSHADPQGPLLWANSSATTCQQTCLRPTGSAWRPS